MNASTTEYIELSKRFANFKDKESLNTSIRQHMYNRKHELTPSAATVFKQIARYAVKFAGCAFLKIAKIMELTGFSRSTVVRALKLLQELGIMLKRPMMRKKSGGNGANLYVIQRYQKVEKIQNDTPPVTPRLPAETPDRTSDEGENFEPETKIPLNPCNKDLIRMESPYERFKSIVFGFGKDKNILYKMYGVYLGQTKWLKDAYRESDLLTAATYSLRTTFNKSKTKNIKNLAGYFNGVLSNSLDKLYYDSVDNILMYDTESEEKTSLSKTIGGAVPEKPMTDEEFQNTCEDIQATMQFLKSTEHLYVEQ